MSEELKPCPFCGEPPIKHFEPSSSVIGCFRSGCPVNPSLRANTFKVAVEKWNTRK